MDASHLVRSARLAVRLAIPAFLLVACCKNRPTEAPTANTATKAVESTAAAPPMTKAACDACNGSWGRHGLNEIEQCNCRTKDAGKVCRDGADCEGTCLAAENGFEVTEKGDPPKGFWKGQCSEFVTTFGCHKQIPHGVRSRGPQTAEDGVDSICVD